jgi:hypothetical protein
MPTLDPLPPGFAETREGLHALACYVIAPARKARTGRIGLRPTGDGFGTPPFDDGSRVLVRRDRLVREPGDATAITTIRDAASFLGQELDEDPGVGHELPPFRPDADLGIDADASAALGAWYAFGHAALERLGATGRTDAGPISLTEAQLWPEHFDLAVTAEVAGGGKVNVGFSPGDTFSAQPYLYVGPQDADGLSDPFWNAPFGAVLTYDALRREPDGAAAADRFIRQGLGVAGRRRGGQVTPR